MAAPEYEGTLGYVVLDFYFLYESACIRACEQLSMSVSAPVKHSDLHLSSMLLQQSATLGAKRRYAQRCNIMGWCYQRISDAKKLNPIAVRLVPECRQVSPYCMI